jgi:hypothetical protein
MNTVVIKNQRTASQCTLMQTKVGQLWRKWLVIDKGYKLQRYVIITHPESVKFLKCSYLSSSDINSVETQEDPKERGISLMKKKNPNYTLSCFVPTCSSILKC